VWSHTKLKRKRKVSKKDDSQAGLNNGTARWYGCKETIFGVLCHFRVVKRKMEFKSF
jgi:hypothetical protein